MPRGQYVRQKKTYELPPELNMLDTETLERFGYAARDVSPGRIEPVMVQCAKCEYHFSRARRQLVPNPECNACMRGGAHVAVSPYLRNDETLEKFGYRAEDLPPADFRKVIARCAQCRRLYEVRRRGLREDGLCRSCLKTNEHAARRGAP